MSEINTQETLAKIEARLSDLEQDKTGIVGIVVLTTVAVTGAWFVTGLVLNRKIERRVKKQEKANKKNKEEK
jgi:preprotein translocase subunit SecG